MGLPALFEQNAARAPQVVAVSSSSGSLTYGELEARANQIGHHLRRHGAGQDVPVAISMDKSLDLVAGLLGIAKSGSAYLPLDPAMPSARAESMLADADAPVLLTRGAAGAAQAAGDGGLVVRTDADGPLIAAEPDTPPSPGPAPDDLAYVMFTSGSTGRPKGVLLNHRGRVNNFHDFNARFGIGPGDSLLSVSSLSFDMTAYDVFGTLMAGARLVLPDPGVSGDPAHWLDLVLRESVTVWHSAPALLQMLVECAQSAGISELPSLRLVLLGGDWIPVPLPDRIKSLAPGARVISLGGATEVSMDSTIYEAGTSMVAAPTILYGRPMANQRIYVLDRNLQPVPIGVAGDLYLAGTGVGRGYLNDPELTAKKFIVTPFPEEPGPRIYRTGDRARYRPDGNLELLGRSDLQIKIRGLRIEPAEIESALRSHPGVRDAVVAAKADRRGTRQLVAYVTVRQKTADGPSAITGDAGPVDEELRAWAQERVPDYMVPNTFVRLSAFPMTRNGKVDRKNLPAPPSAGPGSLGLDRGTAPTTPIEQELAALWREILGVSGAVLEDRFLDLGGHSLSAMMIASRIRARLGVEIAPATVLSTATLAELAASVEQTVASGAISRQAFLPQTTAVSGPLSLAQEPIWFLDRLVPDRPVYNVSLALPWREELDLRVLRRALNRLIARHEALRTRFFETGGRPWQEVGEPWEIALEFGSPNDTLKDAGQGLDSAIQRAASEPLRLENGQPISVRLIEGRPSGDAECAESVRGALVLTIHHIVCDGWTLDILLRELEILFQAEARQDGATEVGLPKLPSRYLDYVLWQRAQARSAIMKYDTEYWRGRLTNAPLVIDFPANRDRPAVQTFRGGHYSFTWDRQLLDRLAGISKSIGVSLYVTLLAGFSTVLSRSTGQRDLVIGTPVTLRSNPSFEHIAGLFINMVPLRLNLSDDPEFRDLAVRVSKEVMSAFDHQNLPFQRLVSQLCPVRDPARTPIVQVLFQFEDLPLRELRLGGPLLRPMRVGTGAAKLDLAMILDPYPDRLAGTVEYNSDIFDAINIRSLVNQFYSFMESVVLDD